MYCGWSVFVSSVVASCVRRKRREIVSPSCIDRENAKSLSGREYRSSGRMRKYFYWRLCGISTRKALESNQMVESHSAVVLQHCQRRKRDGQRALCQPASERAQRGARGWHSTLLAFNFGLVLVWCHGCALIHVLGHRRSIIMCSRALDEILRIAAAKNGRHKSWSKRFAFFITYKETYLNPRRRH